MQMAHFLYLLNKQLNVKRIKRNKFTLYLVESFLKGVKRVIFFAYTWTVEF